VELPETRLGTGLRLPDAEEPLVIAPDAGEPPMRPPEAGDAPRSPG
jgi:hypothetical protein